MKTNTTDNTRANSIDGGARKMSKAGPLAALLGLHKKTLFRWADAGLIHRYKVNARIVLFDLAEVMAFIEKARVA